MSQINLSFSERLAKARALAGVSPEDLSAAVGVHWRTVYRWETGENKPQRSAMHKIAVVLGVSSRWLETGEGNMEETSEPTSALQSNPAVAVPELTDRLSLPVVEIAAGHSGRAPIEDHTLYHAYMTPGEFVLFFGCPPPQMSGPVSGFCIGLLRGESMEPRYQDGERIPLELFPEPLGDLPGGDVHLVRLDGFLYLKAVDRVPKRRDRAAEIVLKSFNKSYEPVTVSLEDGVDFAALGRVRETPKQRLFASLLASQLGL